MYIVCVKCMSLCQVYVVCVKCLSFVSNVCRLCLFGCVYVYMYVASVDGMSLAFITISLVIGAVSRGYSLFAAR